MKAAPPLVSASPHLATGHTTQRIMWTVVASLVPVIGASLFFFGPSALLVIGAATAGAVITERIFGQRGALADGSGLITGLLLGLTLPAGFPMWMAFAGGAFGIGFGKVVFGGLGQNVFNPALLGRAFLQAAFPVAITTWPGQQAHWWSLRGDNFTPPLMSAHAPDVVTEATPLGLMKFEGQGTSLRDLVLGSTGGSLGETAGLVILLCGIYLALRNYLNWRIPIAVMLSAAVLTAALHFLSPARFPDAAFTVFSGGLMLGAWYMATDPVTSPVTNKGCWIFGAGIGALVVIIRIWGGLAEGVMYAVLLMNALVPFINRATQPVVFGTRRVAQ